MTMFRLNIHEAKTHLSRYLQRLARGEMILLCKRNVPIAEIRPITPQTRKKRPIGGVPRESLKIPPSFFEPLPDELLDAFEGKSP